MALETLGSSKINTWVNIKDSDSRVSALAHFNELKMNSHFYNKDSDQLSVSGNTKEYLLDALVRRLVGDNYAQECFFVTQAFNYNRVYHLWGHQNIYSTKLESVYFTSNQLLGIIADSLFDQDQMQEDYKALHTFPFLDKEKNLLADRIVKSSSFQYNQDFNHGTDFKTQDQLTNVIVEALFDEDSSYRKYQYLISSPFLYDTIHGFWKENPNKNDIFSKYTRTNTQLLGVLAMACFDTKNAKEQFERLQNSSLYNPQKKLWYDDDSKLVSRFEISSQLLSVWCEHVLEISSVAQTLPNLPIKRTF